MLSRWCFERAQAPSACSRPHGTLRLARCDLIAADGSFLLPKEVGQGLRDRPSGKHRQAQAWTRFLYDVASGCRKTEPAEQEAL